MHGARIAVRGPVRPSPASGRVPVAGVGPQAGSAGGSAPLVLPWRPSKEDEPISATCGPALRYEEN